MVEKLKYYFVIAYSSIMISILNSSIFRVEIFKYSYPEKTRILRNTLKAYYWYLPNHLRVKVNILIEKLDKAI